MTQNVFTTLLGDLDRQLNAACPKGWRFDVDARNLSNVKVYLHDPHGSAETITMERVVKALTGNGEAEKPPEKKDRDSIAEALEAMRTGFELLAEALERR